MANISVHYSKQERESDNSEQSRIDFFVSRSAVSIHYFLKHFCELVGLEKSGNFGILWNIEGLELATYHVLVLFSCFSQQFQYFFFIFFGAPAFALVDVIIADLKVIQLFEYFYLFSDEKIKVNQEGTVETLFININVYFDININVDINVNTYLTHMNSSIKLSISDLVRSII